MPLKFSFPMEDTANLLTRKKYFYFNRDRKMEDICQSKLEGYEAKSGRGKIGIHAHGQ